MKFLLFLFSTLMLYSSCKEDQDPIITEPTPTYYTFQGEIGVNDNSTVLTVDTSLLICGNAGSNISILKISKMGSLIWRKDVNAGTGSYASGIAISTNQDVFICGSTSRNLAHSRRDVLLVKTNSNGDTLWTRTYGGSEDDFGYYILTTEDGNLLIGGSSYSYSSDAFTDIYLIKVNMDGDTLWTRTFPDNDQERAFHLLQTQNGEYLVTGTNEDASSNRELYLIKVSSNGTRLWNKKIGPPIWKWGFSTVEIPNGDLLTCGKISHDGISQVLLVKTDAQGNVIWEKEYGETNLSEEGNAIQLNGDGTFIITGSSYSSHTGLSGVVLLKVDQNGEQLCWKVFGGLFIDYGQNIIKDENDDNIITGQYNGAIFMTRTDNNCVFK